ncbi:hypothetical protein J4409_01835 [Candidatus Woesearchaeota archaeon]|nr:hypothetical protein [Candidatus Woesearchaeota archaeon]
MQLLKNLFNSKKKPAKAKRDHEKLKKQVSYKLDYALHKKDESLFISTLKDFFSEFFHIKHEFTFEELLKIVNAKKISKNTRAKLTGIIGEINETYYSTEKLPKEKLKEFNSGIKEVIREL